MQLSSTRRGPLAVQTPISAASGRSLANALLLKPPRVRRALLRCRGARWRRRQPIAMQANAMVSSLRFRVSARGGRWRDSHVEVGSRCSPSQAVIRAWSQSPAAIARTARSASSTVGYGCHVHSLTSTKTRSATQAARLSRLEVDGFARGVRAGRRPCRRTRGRTRGRQNRQRGHVTRTRPGRGSGAGRSSRRPPVTSAGIAT